MSAEALAAALGMTAAEYAASRAERLRRTLLAIDHVIRVHKAQREPPMVAIVGAHLRMAANHDVALAVAADPEKPLEHFQRCLELVADLADGRRGEPAEQARAAELQVVLAQWLFAYPCKRIHAIFAGQEAADAC